MTEALIFGAGNYARLLYAYLHQHQAYRLTGFTVTAEHRETVGSHLLGLPVLAFEDIAPERAGSIALFLGVGYSGVNVHRRNVFERAKQTGFRLPAFVHSTAHVDPTAQIGEASIVLEGALLQPFAALGANSVLWSNSSVLHDSIVEPHAFIAGGVTISGGCHIGERAFLGAGAVLRDGVRIGASAVVGAGVTALEDVPPEAVLKAAAPVRLPTRSGALRGI